MASKTIRYIVLIGVVVGGIYGFVGQRQAIYHYPVDNDYVYDFPSSVASQRQLPIDQGNISLPTDSQEFDTAILSINIKPSLPAYFLPPAITISNGPLTLYQSFEHGAAGVRYLNLSRFLNAKPQQIHLGTQFISISGTQVSLFLFPKRDLSKTRILVLAPHPDDAELAAYGLYSHSQSYIATITAGEGGKNTYDEIYPDSLAGHLKKAQLRVWDSLFIPSLGGVPPDKTVNLGYFDSTLKAMFTNKSQNAVSNGSGIRGIHEFRQQNISTLLVGQDTASPTWGSLVNDLAMLLQKIKPDIIVTPYPAIDGHDDHKYTTVALFSAIKQLGLRQGQLYLYSNHNIYNDFYPYGEAGDPVTLPPNFGKPPYFASLYAHPLSSDDQHNKLFALEAMHDLRLDTEWLEPKGAFKVFRKSLKKHLFGYDESYFRRAVRDNELFFVVPVEDIYQDAILKRLQG